MAMLERGTVHALGLALSAYTWRVSSLLNLIAHVILLGPPEQVEEAALTFASNWRALIRFV